MNKLQDGVSGAIPAGEVRIACESILASEMFAHAPRMSRLLHFLVEKAICGVVEDTSEYAIGLEVFDRNVLTYNTNEDPIVRVQVGRLREKLKVYYATLGAASDIEISIAVGGYMPVIRRRSMAKKNLRHIPTFAIHPFKCISHHGNGESFTQGLQDELAHQLFKAFGKIVIANSFFGPGANDRRASKNASRADANHRIEGSIQIEAERIRTSIRLVDASTGCIAWSEQFNRKVSLAIALQEELALSICGALKHFFGQE
jgi:TolB-like protein